MASKFDKDKDGRLNTGERRDAFQAIEEGFEDQFEWDLDEAGADRKMNRVMQFRGAICNYDDFGPVTDTYPRHPLQDVKPEY